MAGRVARRARGEPRGAAEARGGTLTDEAQPVGESQRSVARRTQALAEFVFGVGGAVASTVYGTIVVMATLTAGYATQTHPWKLAGIVASTVGVLWIAHVYAHGLSESITLSRRLTLDEATHIGRREAGILFSAAAPLAALLVGAMGVVDETTAVWIALAIGLVTLAAEGVRYARLERFGRTATFVAVAINVSLGLLVVALKVSLAH